MDFMGPSNNKKNGEEFFSSSDEDAGGYSLAENRPKKRAGRRVFKETRHPVYRGVRRRNGDKWVCEMREPKNKKTRIWLGSYPTPEMAARAHDVAALAFRGKSACLNFADSAWRLPVPSTLDAAEVRRVANEAAQMFHPGAGDHQTNGSYDFSSSQGIAVGNYEDEDATTDMRGLLTEMAQGLLMPPPTFVEDNFDSEWETNDYFSLWSH